MFPSDFTIGHAAAVTLVLVSWWAYSAILSKFSRGSLNAQLATVRRRWLKLATQRETKPFDAILLGHIVNSIAFFGSATLIVLAGIITMFVNMKSLHETVSHLPFFTQSSLDLFALKLAFVTFILVLCFFSFTYALRKLIYLLALMGALPGREDHRPEHDIMIESAATILSEAVQTFNFGIRGYYYSVAALCLFISPTASIIATTVVTMVLFYRQLATPTARAIQQYVEAQRSLDD